MELTEPTVWSTDRLELGEGLRWVDDRLVLVDLLAGRLLKPTATPPPRCGRCAVSTFRSARSPRWPAGLVTGWPPPEPASHCCPPPATPDRSPTWSLTHPSPPG